MKQLQQIHILFEYVAAYEKEVFVWAGPRRGGSSLIVTGFLTDECESLILNWWHNNAFEQKCLWNPARVGVGGKKFSNFQRQIVYLLENPSKI